MLDVLIKQGNIVDGTGASRRIGDVGISDGRVVAIGEIRDGARRTIDAEGMIVAPGFIDVHTHLDAQVFWDPTLSPSPLHGVTTVVAGNCGFSLAPLTPSVAEYVMRMLARVEGMPLAALEAGVPWNWTTTQEYLETLEHRLAVNAGFMVGHSTIRRMVMGEAATEREATPEELNAMRQLVHESLAAGGLGFSSTRFRSHHDGEGRPVPSRHASFEEFIELARVCADHPGTGLQLSPHVGTRFPEAIVDLMIHMSAAAQRPLNYNSLMAYESNLDECAGKLSASEVARDRGAKIVALAQPERDALRFNFATAFLLDALPGWDKAMALPLNEKLALLRNPKERRQLAESVIGRGNPGGGIDLGDWGSRRIVETFAPEAKRYEGRIVSDIAAEEQKDDFDALVDIACMDGLRTVFAILPPPDSIRDWEARVGVLCDPRVVIGASDAGAHLDMSGSFNYTTRLFAKAVRQYELMTTEEAVHRLTQVPASLYGLRDRGVIADGSAADVVIFSEEAIGTEPLATRFDLPTGAPRLYADATGIAHVLVNGQPIVDHGSFTDARPGTILRSGRDTVTPSMN